MIMEERCQINGVQKMEEIMLPGFRFHPTDEELVGFYLKKKVQERTISIEVIKPLDIYKHDPWDLPKLATTGEKEWYFYCRRDQKYRNSARPNRVTGSGFWKATGTDRPIYSDGSRCIGLKKSLVFYKGRAAKGFKTDWMMHEYRLPSAADHNGRAKRFHEKTIPPNELWAICRIFKKTSSSAQRALSHSFVTPILQNSTSPIISQYDTDCYHGDHKAFIRSNPSPHILLNNNQTPRISISSDEDIDHLFSVHEPDHNTNIDASSLLFNLQPSIFGDFGEKGLDYITLGQQYFHNSCSPIASLPTPLQEKLEYGDQDQELSIDLMFQSPTNFVYFDNQWDFTNTNDCLV